ncbi:MAG TPA: PTS sugar transporter subunit IIC [Syntrophales bacterium]|nr:PTS sugar transporter subunit IIC [Syntrophales bacterium]HOX95094.1 PTS sugar transporter subunit IIC [Syntrophales bacterium]HPI57851.1 PTS sugar transporter subunit IIC [Syntrophales bacterium]HPN24509.1 PTS sugar transporter subunit IIC [Syntrophales bacterium]HQM28815.1 PTS sugar transporter subunit IIC [Syntrophales bacterium]
MLVDLAILSLLGGVLCLERITLQMMISRPVVAGPIIGLVLGEPHIGLVSGALVELLWIDRLAVGAYVPPHDTIVAVLVTAGAAIGGRELSPFSQEIMAFSVLLYLPAGILGQRMDVWVRHYNDRLAREVLEEVKAGNIRAVSRNHLRAILRTWLLATAFIFVAAVAGLFLTQIIFPPLPSSVLRMLHYTYFFLPLLGIGVALNTIQHRGAIPLFCGVFLLLSAAKEFLWT